MAAPKTVKVTLTNTADGPRSFFDAECQNHILRKGESWSGEIFEADKGDLSSDLAQGDKAAREAEPGPDAEAALATKIADDAKALLASNDLPKLQAIAKDEKVKVPDDATQDQLALLIAQARNGVKA